MALMGQEGMLLGTLYTRIVADAQQYYQELNRAEGAARRWQVAVGGMLSALGGAAGYLLTQSTLTAARTQVLGTALYAVGKNAGYTREQLDAYTEQIKKMGITTQEARLALIRFIQSNLDVSKAAQLARVAQDLAVIAAENSSKAFSDLTHAINAQRPVLLRQYGIVKNLDEIYREYGKRLGIYTETITEAGEVQGHWVRQLTDTEKKMAFLNVILEEGQKVAGVYVSAMEDAGKKIGSLPRVIQEAQNALGREFLPILKVVVDALYEFLKWFDQQPRVFQQAVAYALALAAAFGTLGGAALMLGPALAEAAGALGTLVAAGAGVGAAIAALAAAWTHNVGGIQDKARGLVQTLRDVGKAVAENLGPPAREMVHTWRDTLVQVAADVSAALKNMGIDIGEIWNKIKQLIGEGITRFAYEMLAFVVQVVETLEVLITALGKSFQDTDKAMEYLRQEMQRIGQIRGEMLREQVERIREEREAVEALTAAYGRMDKATQQWIESQRQAAEEMREAAQQASLTETLWQQIADAIKEQSTSARSAVEQEFQSIADRYKAAAVNIVRLEFQRQQRLAALQREYLRLRQQLQQRGDVAHLALLNKAYNRKRKAILTYYQMRIEDQKRAQQAMLVMAKSYLTVALAELKTALAKQVAAYGASAETILSITKHAYGGVTTLSRAALKAMRGAWNIVEIQNMIAEVQGMFDQIERQAKEAAASARREFTAWSEANLSLRDSIFDVGVSLDTVSRSSERLKNPLEEAAKVADRIAGMVGRVREALEELAAFGVPHREGWEGPLREVLDAATTMVHAWAERVREIVERDGHYLVNEGQKQMQGALSAVSGVAHALRATLDTIERLSLYEPPTGLDDLVQAVAEAAKTMARELLDALSGDLMTALKDKSLERAMPALSNVLAAVGKTAEVARSLEGTLVPYRAKATVEAMADLATMVAETFSAERIGYVGAASARMAQRLSPLLSAVKSTVEVAKALREAGPVLAEANRMNLKHISVLISRLAEGWHNLAQEILVTARAHNLAQKMKDLVAPVKAVADMAKALSDARRAVGTDMGHVIGWAVEIMAQVAVYVGRLQWRLPPLHRGRAEAMAIAQAIGEMIAPVRQVAEAAKALSDVRHLRGTDMGHVIGWAAELMAQVAVYVGELQWRLPPLHRGRAEAVAIAKAIEEMIAPVRKVAELAQELGRARFLRGTDMGHVIGWAVELMAQVAVYMSELEQRLPRTLKPKATTTALAEAMGEMGKALREIITFVNDLQEVAWLRRRLGMGNLARWLGAIIVHIARMAREIPRGLLQQAQQQVEGMRAVGEIFSALGNVVRTLADAAQLRNMEKARDNLTRVVEVWKQMMSRLDRAIREGEIVITPGLDIWANTTKVVVEALGAGVQTLLNMRALATVEDLTPTINKFVADLLYLVNKLKEGLDDFNAQATGALSVWGQALNTLMEGLDAALRVALGLPRQWGVDVNVWADFREWVKRVFTEFYAWVNPEGEVPFGDDGLQMMETFSAALSALMGGLQAALQVQAGIPATWEVPEGVWDAFIAWVKDIFMDLYIWSRTISTNPSDFAPVQAFGQAMTAVFSGLKAALDVLDGVVGLVIPKRQKTDAFLAEVKRIFDDLKNEAERLGEEAINVTSEYGNALQSLMGGLRSALDLFVRLMEGNTRRFIGTSGQPDGEFAKALSDLVQGITLTMDAFRTWVIERYQGVWSKAADTLLQKISAVIDTMRAALDLFTALQQHGLPDTSLIQKFIEQTLNLFRAFAEEMKETDEDVAQANASVVATLRHGARQVEETRWAWQNAAEVVGGAFVMTLQAVVNIEWQGRQFAQGLALGMLKERGYLVSAAHALAQAMLNELKAVWGISSPSRVAMDIGRNIAQSMAAGLNMAGVGLGQGLLPPQVEVTGEKRLFVDVNVRGDALTPEARLELARELAHLIRANV